MKKISLKSKIALCSFLVFLVFMPMVTISALHFFQHQFISSIEGQLFTTVSLLADELDQKILSTQAVVIAEARGISSDLFSDPQRALAHLEQRHGILALLDNGVALFTASGKMVAETRNKPSRTGLDLSYRSYIKKTIATRKPYISDPFITTQEHKHPIVVLTVPILDHQGELLGIFAGSIDLLGENLLGLFATAKVGQTGYFYLFTADRTIIMHPDRARIMQQDVPLGANELFDLALEGFEGSGETVNSRGVRTLSSFKRLGNVNWLLAASYPIAEAFAPVRSAERWAWIIVVCGGLVVATLMWLAMRQLIVPLLSLTHQLKEITGGKGHHKRVKITSRDEIGALGESFNSLMGELECRESQLSQSQELYQTLADWSNNWVFWKSAEGKMLYISPAATKITGYTTAELMEFGDHSDQLVHPDDRELWQQHLCESGQGKAPPALDFRIITKNGEERWLSHFCQPIYSENGAYLGLRGSNTDISVRKKVEEQLRHLSTRDSLTGLYNRGYFDNKLARLVSGRCFPVSLVVADIDQLKPVNDEQGHAVGDQLIKQAASLLLQSFRVDDVVARIGGDEFAVLMAGSDESAVNCAVQRLRSLEDQHNTAGIGLKLGLSVGMVTALDGNALEGAMLVADARMYQDKRQRRAPGERES
jgi:two-component system NtrC family sensor kinase